MYSNIFCPHEKVITVKEAILKINDDLQKYKEGDGLNIHLPSLVVLIHAINKANLIDIDKDL